MLSPNTVHLKHLDTEHLTNITPQTSQNNLGELSKFDRLTTVYYEPLGLMPPRSKVFRVRDEWNKTQKALLTSRTHDFIVVVRRLMCCDAILAFLCVFRKLFAQKQRSYYFRPFL